MQQGETMFGTPQDRGIVGARASTRESNAPGMIHLQTYNGTTTLDWYIWVDANGNVRGLNTIPTNQNADGTILSVNPM